MKEFTKRSLAKTFMEMCEEVPLKDISIKDFIEYAGISKQTFYNYFRDKSDIMNYVFEIAAEKIIAKMSTSVEGMFYGSEKMAQVCLENRNFYVQLAKYETQNDFLQCFRKDVEEVYTRKLKENLGTGRLDKKLEKIIHLYCTGACVVFTEWIKGGMKESPEELADVIISCIPKDIIEGLKEKQPKNNSEKTR